MGISIESRGGIRRRFELAEVTCDIDEAIDGVKYVFVVTPPLAHEDYAKLIKIDNERKAAALIDKLPEANATSAIVRARAPLAKTRTA